MCRRYGRITFTSYVCMYMLIHRGDLSFGVSLEVKPCMMKNR